MTDKKLKEILSQYRELLITRKIGEVDGEELDRLANEYVSNYGCEDYDDGVDEQKQIDTKKLLQLVEYVYELLKLNENPEDIYPILSWMCRNGYFTNFEFKDEDIFINGKQITKDGLLIILNNE